jgi:hypothetical protein
MTLRPTLHSGVTPHDTSTLGFFSAHAARIPYIVVYLFM